MTDRTNLPVDTSILSNKSILKSSKIYNNGKLKKKFLFFKILEIDFNSNEKLNGLNNK